MAQNHKNSPPRLASKPPSSLIMHCPACHAYIALQANPVTKAADSLTFDNMIIEKGTRAGHWLYKANKNPLICSHCHHEFTKLKNFANRYVINTENIVHLLEQK